VTAAFLTLIVIGWQAVETKRAAEATQASARATADSVEAINRQAGILERQAAATEKAADAARDGAEATKRSIEVMIKKERARLKVRMKPFNLHPIAGHPSIEYAVSYYGIANASIKEAGVTAYVSNSSERETGGLAFPVPQIPEIITASTPPMHAATFLQPNMIVEDATIDDIEKGKLFVHFWGNIKYDDGFGEVRETNFRYLWTVTSLRSLSGGGRPYSYWKQHGEEADNRET
jgi:hypothetical protein